MGEHVLVTGGTGKTGRRVAAALAGHDVAVRVAARSVSGAGTLRFDWCYDRSFDRALDGITAVYLVAPTDTTAHLAVMRPFLDRALARRVRRFVLLSASSLDEGGPMMGEVHAYLKAQAAQWTVLRPSWFMQNFSEGQHQGTIHDEDAIYSATGEGKVAFIDADDIAAVAVQALLRPDFPSGDIVLTGSAALSYGDVAAIISQTTGRTIEHRHLSEAALAQRFEALGLPAGYARTLAALDSAIAAGAEDRTTTAVADITGRPARTFAAFAGAARMAWRR